MPTFGDPGPADLVSWFTEAGLAGEPLIQKDSVTDPPVDFGRIARQATLLMWRWSGRQYGLRTQRVRPIVAGGLWRLVGLSFAEYSPVAWLDASAELVFPCRVHEVTSVIVGGVALSSSLWALYDHERLVRLDGLTWPIDQNLTRPNTDPTAYEIVATFGAPPPADGIEAALALGVELARERAGLKCRLPSGLVETSKPGLKSKGRLGMPNQGNPTGIFAIDAFLDAANPKRRTKRASVASPETVYPSQRT